MDAIFPCLEALPDAPSVTAAVTVYLPQPATRRRFVPFTLERVVLGLAREVLPVGP